MSELTTLINYVDNGLLPNTDMKSVCSFDPIVVDSVPEPWILLGGGNYAAGLIHPEFPEYVVKIYVQGRHGIEEEIRYKNEL